MMKTRLTKNLLMTALAVLCSASGLLAQDDFVPVDTTIVMDPGMFIPADTGYFVAGVDKDLDEDGIPEHYEGCYDAYGDADHREDGMQNGWEYENVIIFRGCDLDAQDDVIKGTQPTENWPTVGNIIQVTKHKYAYTDSAQYGYIASPPFTNLQSLTVKVGTDLSLGGREIFMLIEASLDGGETWEYIDNPEGNAFLIQQMLNQGGDIHEYIAGSGVNEGFDEIVAASETQPIQLRFLPVPPFGSDPSTTNGERLKFWEITIEAKTAPNTGGGGGGGPLASRPTMSQDPFVVSNYTFTATQGKDLYVYRLSGVLVGKGKEVPVYESGLYLVRTGDGKAKKVYLK